MPMLYDYIEQICERGYKIISDRFSDRFQTEKAKPLDPRTLINLFRGQSTHPALINCLWLLLKNLYPVDPTTAHKERR